MNRASGSAPHVASHQSSTRNATAPAPSSRRTDRWGATRMANSPAIENSPRRAFDIHVGDIYFAAAGLSAG